MIKNVVVYGKMNCTYCDKSKMALDIAGIPYTYTDIMLDEDVLDWFMEQKFRTVPQIFVDGEHIGGYDQLVETIKAQ